MRMKNENNKEWGDFQEKNQVLPDWLMSIYNIIDYSCVCGRSGTLIIIQTLIFIRKGASGMNA